MNSPPESPDKGEDDGLNQLLQMEDIKLTSPVFHQVGQVDPLREEEADGDLP